MKYVSFFTLGCRLNQAEEEGFKRDFLKASFIVTEPEIADIVIVNTCSVTALADKKTRQTIRKLKNKNFKMKIVAIGCGASLVKDMQEVDLAIPNNKKKDLLKIILKAPGFVIKQRQIDQGTKKKATRLIKEANGLSSRTRAPIKIQDGCNNYCAYCIVPYLRGREVSFSPLQIIKEAKFLEKMGYKELVVSGINVGKYSYNLQSSFLNFQKGDIINLKKLLVLLLREANFPRIRLSSINPQDVSNEIIDLWANEKRLCRHLHLSLQSGSDTVLKRMGRPYSAQKYYSMVNKITQKIPEIAITTDVIVGFPGESKADFLETIDFIKKVNFAKIHVFPYSKREDTKAQKMTDQVDPAEIRNRAKILRREAKDLRKKYISRFVGTEQEVLFEEKKGECWQGLTSNYIRVKYKNNKNLENQMLKIKINNFKIVS